MEKYLQIPISVLVASGTTTSDESGNGLLVDTSATFITDGVQAGDLIHVTGDDNYYLIVASVDGETTLSTNEALGVGEDADYFIHSATVFSTSQVSVTDVKVVEEAKGTNGTVNDELLVSYEDGLTTKMVFFGEPSNLETQRDTFQECMVKALRTDWKSVSHPCTLPKTTIGISITAAS